MKKVYKKVVSCTMALLLSIPALSGIGFSTEKKVLASEDTEVNIVVDMNGNERRAAAMAPSYEDWAVDTTMSDVSVSAEFKGVNFTISNASEGDAACSKLVGGQYKRLHLEMELHCLNIPLE